VAAALVSDRAPVILHHLEPTAILDYDSPGVVAFARSIESGTSETAFLHAAHAAIASQVRPVYTVKERQPVSVTIAREHGSCSQRLACLEAVARRQGIGTRVRALWVAGRFWNNRFPLSRWLIPERILLAWPQFRIGDRWCGVEDLFGAVEDRAPGATAFANDGETLFEAVRSTAVDFDGRTRDCKNGCDLSAFVVSSDGLFNSRDDLFRALGSFEDTWKGKAFESFYAGRPSA
jgi:Transglutaminase-like superfamily